MNVCVKVILGVKVIHAHAHLADLLLHILVFSVFVLRDISLAEGWWRSLPITVVVFCSSAMTQGRGSGALHAGCAVQVGHLQGRGKKKVSKFRIIALCTSKGAQSCSSDIVHMCVCIWRCLKLYPTLRKWS